MTRYRVTNLSSSERSFTADGEFRKLFSGEQEILNLSDEEHDALGATREFGLMRMDPPVQAEVARQRTGLDHTE